MITGNILPFVINLMLFLSSYCVGNKFVSIFVDQLRLSKISRVLVGYGIFGTLTGILAHFPINTAGLYGVLIIIPILIFRNNISELKEILIKPASPNSRLAGVAFTFCIIIFNLKVYMPEVGHDALVTHLFIPSHMASLGKWSFNVELYSFAVMPLLGDWIYSITYITAGEYGARLTNFIFILIICKLIYMMVFELSQSKTYSLLAALLFLATPITYLEVSTLYIESIWTAFIIAAMYELFRCLNNKEFSCSAELAGLLGGFSLATKAVSFTVLPSFIPIILFIKYINRNNFSLLKFILFSLLAGSTPYITALILTSNPVYPFFNGVFKSDFYPHQNFDASFYSKGLNFNFFYEFVFETSKYLEAKKYGGGFEWIFLFIPTLFLAILKKNAKLLLLFISFLLSIYLTFLNIAYLRYIYPCYAILMVAIGFSLSLIKNYIIRAIYIFLALITIVFNIYFINNAGWYGDIDISLLMDSSKRDAYLIKRVPIRLAVDLINNLNKSQDPVFVYASPLVAGINSDVIYPNVYNWKMADFISKVKSSYDLLDEFNRQNIKYLVIDNKHGDSSIRSMISNVSELVERIGPLEVRRVQESMQFGKQLLINPNLNGVDGWSIPNIGSKNTRDLFIANVDFPITQMVAVKAFKNYKLTILSECISDGVVGRLQVNWLNETGGFVDTTIETYFCSQKPTEESMTLKAPKNSSVAVIYLSSHSSLPIRYLRASFSE